MKSFVKAWDETITIPTYEAQAADKNPMFLEKRVYQGSSGKVYPHPVTESISNEKTDKEYKAVFLENEYLQVMILPELGGRIQRALDKTNNYDFVYYNHVIKPALVGLAGPWISGGIEFNWPQHHRPSTYDPVDFRITENDDGSVTVWVSEIEKMYHTKGMAGFTLHPGKAYIEIKGQLYNPTDRTQTFLWWANPAVAVNNYTQSIFPPDVHAVMDHGKRDVSSFPIATGTYYKVDYSAGVDISMYKNIPVPTSYMAYHSDYNFIGNYDYSKNAGLMHVADHHISPGKKQWTWGNGDFGRAWDRNLTDEDGPYIELMTGVYTDNQPDFTFIEPHEEKTFVQYFMPYKDVGAAKNATIDAMLNVERDGQQLHITIYPTSEQSNAVITVSGKNGTYLNETFSMSPTNTYKNTITLTSEENDVDLRVFVIDSDGNTLVSYEPMDKEPEPIPEPAKPSLLPEEIETCEELFLTAVHLEQYRHATYRPDDYYIEGLCRDATDIRLNNGYGKLLYKRGLWNESIPYFKKAVEKLTWKNPNPYTGEPYYNLGLALKRSTMGTYNTDAFDAFYKAIWNGATQDSSYYQLASLACMKGDLREALDFINKSLVKNSHSLKSRTLKTALMRRLGKMQDAINYAKDTISIDCMDFGASYELYTQNMCPDFSSMMRNEPHNYIELSLNYAECGLYDDAYAVLDLLKDCSNPMYWYYKAWFSSMLGNDPTSLLNKAASSPSDYCFPNRLTDITVLEFAIAKNPADGMAPYYLGNLLYDKCQYEKAVQNWELSTKLAPKFPTAYRNLSLAYFNKYDDHKKALSLLETAFSLDTKDARVFLELDQLKKRLNVSIAERLAAFEKNISLIQLRDDLYTEYMTLLNMTGQYETALECISNHMFHPWEGGEGKIPMQYKTAHMELAKRNLANGDIKTAISHLNDALVYPQNLGEGKLDGSKDNDIYYLLGKSYEMQGDTASATDCYKKATLGDIVLSSAMYYNDQPPELYFYQLLANCKLGNASADDFNALISYGTEHENDEMKIDYFAVSLPDFLIFESDLNAKNFVHCQYMKALGYMGVGENEKAKELLNTANKLEQSHQGIYIHQNILLDFVSLLG